MAGDLPVRVGRTADASRGGRRLLALAQRTEAFCHQLFWLDDNQPATTDLDQALALERLQDVRDHLAHRTDRVGQLLLSPVDMQSGGDASCHLGPDRKSTRLNSSHSQISYAVFCLKKK